MHADLAVVGEVTNGRAIHVEFGVLIQKTHLPSDGNFDHTQEGTWVSLSRDSRLATLACKVATVARRRAFSFCSPSTVLA